MKKNYSHHTDEPKNSSDTIYKKLKTQAFTRALKNIDWPLYKHNLIDYFETDIQISQDIVNKLNEFEDVAYHSLAELMDEFERVHHKKSA